MDGTDEPLDFEVPLDPYEAMIDKSRERREEVGKNYRKGYEQAELKRLAKKTNGQPTDADRDIDFAYRHMGLPTVSPRLAPSVPAWEWYQYARREPDKFLEICAKREDAKSKAAGTINEKRMEDDKRAQFSMIERLSAGLKQDITSIVGELADRFPKDVAEVLKNRGWKVEATSA